MIHQSPTFGRLAVARFSREPYQTPIRMEFTFLRESQTKGRENMGKREPELCSYRLGGYFGIHLQYFLVASHWKVIFHIAGSPSYREIYYKAQIYHNNPQVHKWALPMSTT